VAWQAVLFCECAFWDSSIQAAVSRSDVESAMKSHMGLVLVLVVVSYGGIDAKASTLSGWVSDESCGRAHIKPGKESCVAKCLRGGASVGHPEWLPQRMVLVSDDGTMLWIVENPETLINHAGQHVLVDARSGKGANGVWILRLRSTAGRGPSS
jgi:hypothetical protein